MSDEYGDPISYQALQPGTRDRPLRPPRTRHGRPRDRQPKEHIFDGIVMRAGDRLLWVDAPEVARIQERRVTLTIDEQAARELRDYAPEPPSTAPTCAGAGPAASSARLERR